MLLGFDLRDYDSATRYAWKYLRDASADQVNVVHNLALSADARLVYPKVLGALLNNAQRRKPEGTPIYGLWNGDGNLPPSYITTDFDGDSKHARHSRTFPTERKAEDFLDTVSADRQRGTYLNLRDGRRSLGELADR